jgi:hypothetical protein
MPMHIAEVIACIIFLYKKIFVSYKTSLLALQLFPNLGGGDNSILWLSFAQQKMK